MVLEWILLSIGGRVAPPFAERKATMDQTGEGTEMNIIRKFRTASNRKAARWELVIDLVLLVLIATSSLFLPSSAIQAGVQDGDVQSPNRSLGATANTQRTVTYAYDSAGRLTRADYGEDGALVYHYDPAGNLVGLTPGGEYHVYLPLVMR